MANKEKLREILAILSPDGTQADFADFDKGVEKLKKGLKEKIQAKTLEDVNGQLRRVKEGMDLTPLLTALENIDKTFDSRIKEVAGALAQEVERFNATSELERTKTGLKVAENSGLVETLQEELAVLKGQKEKETNDVLEALSAIPRFKEEYVTEVGQIKTRLDTLELPKPEEPDVISPIKQEIQAVRSDLITRINNRDNHGGNMNRNIAIGGNTSVLSRYTDINLKAGANVTITYAYNDVTKYTDVTLAASGGGGGSVGGIIRSINNISTSQSAGAVAGTDYVYIASAGVKVTLPDAAANTNLYTVKNTSSSSVMIDTTSAQTIDGSANLILPVQFTSVDLISNGSNWDIT